MVVIEVRARALARSLAVGCYFSLVSSKQKDQRAQHKNRSGFLHVCVLFFFFSDVLRLLRLHSTLLDLCVSTATIIITTTTAAIIHSVIYSFTSARARAFLVASSYRAANRNNK